MEIFTYEDYLKYQKYLKEKELSSKNKEEQPSKTKEKQPSHKDKNQTSQVKEDEQG